MANPNMFVIPDLGDEIFTEDEIAFDLNPLLSQESIPSTNVNETENTSKRQKKSLVWQYFKEEMMPSKTNPGQMELRATCKLCKSNYSRKGGGCGTLKRHLETCIPKHQNLNNQEGVGGGRQQTISLTSQGGLQNWTYDAQRCRDGLAKFIASSELPISFADDDAWEEFIQVFLCPQYKRVSRNTTRADIMKNFLTMRQSLVSDFKDFSCTISTTSDLWEGSNKLGYCAITAHFIDDNWVLQKRIIGFRLMPYPHNASAIYSTISEVFKFYGIQQKILTITLDNASSNNSAVRIFKANNNMILNGDLFHQRCACHIINLVVQAGLSQIEKHISKIRECLVYIITSGPRRQEFEQFCRDNNKPARKFTTDVKHRWNSTYLMLGISLPYKDIISTFVNERFTEVKIENSDWELAKFFHGFLKVFYGATELLSGVYYPTSHLALHQLFCISRTFQTYKQYSIFAPIIEPMENKFKAYWDGIPILYVIATILDPRCQLGATGSLINAIASNLQVQPGLTIESAKDTLEQIFLLYSQKFKTGGDQPQQQPQVDPSPFDPNNESWNFIWSERNSSTSSSQSSSSELVKYLSSDFSFDNPSNFDILEWWRGKQGRFPTLAIIARDILAVPVTSVASEQAFSASNRVLDERRSRMRPDILEGLMCLKDWEDARRRRQNYDDGIALQFSNLEIGSSSSSVASNIT